VKPKVYLETTFISYLTARPSRDLVIAAHQQVSQDWWLDSKPYFELFISQLVKDEASGGDKKAAKERLKALAGIPLLPTKPEALELAKAMMNEALIPQTAAEDALHIALATTNGMDYLMTWNLKHIANARMRSHIEALCRAEGYEPPVICTPEELKEVNDG
jgi:predicted nucleic acid-binding protein